jgi:hypothetical protein
MGSPLFGTPFTTTLVASRDNSSGSDEHVIWLGAFFWTLIHGGVAVVLFMAKVVTFDHCLGRMSELGQPPNPWVEKKPAIGVKLEFDDDPDDNLIAVSEPPQSWVRVIGGLLVFPAWKVIAT